MSLTYKNYPNAGNVMRFYNGKNYCCVDIDFLNIQKHSPSVSEYDCEEAFIEMLSSDTIYNPIFSKKDFEVVKKDDYIIILITIQVRESPVKLEIKLEEEVSIPLPMMLTKIKKLEEKVNILSKTIELLNCCPMR